MTRVFADDHGTVHLVCETPYANVLARCEAERAYRYQMGASSLVPIADRKIRPGAEEEVTCLSCLSARGPR